MRTCITSCARASPRVHVCTCTAAGKFALKDKDAAMAAAFTFLRSKGAFPEDDGDDSDDMIFGDDDNLEDYM